MAESCQHWYLTSAQHPKACEKCGELTIKKEKYRCQECKGEFLGYAGPTTCRMCGSIYIDWLSYVDLPSHTNKGDLK